MLLPSKGKRKEGGEKVARRRTFKGDPESAKSLGLCARKLQPIGAGGECFLPCVLNSAVSK